MMRKLIKAGQKESFRAAVGEYFCVEPLGLGLAGGEKAFETMEVRERLSILTMSQMLISGWPQRFVRFCQETGLWRRRAKRRDFFIKELSAEMEGSGEG